MSCNCACPLSFILLTRERHVIIVVYRWNNLVCTLNLIYFFAKNTKLVRLITLAFNGTRYKTIETIVRCFCACRMFQEHVLIITCMTINHNLLVYARPRAFCVSLNDTKIPKAWRHEQTKSPHLNGRLSLIFTRQHSELRVSETICMAFVWRKRFIHSTELENFIHEM